LIGIEPKDEFEGMIAAQLLAAHNAALGDLDDRTSAAGSSANSSRRWQRIGAAEISHLNSRSSHPNQRGAVGQCFIFGQRATRGGE
jgi:hypothetical protein